MVIDVSPSMPIGELNAGLKVLYERLREDAIVRATAELSVVTYADTADVIMERASVESCAGIPTLHHQGRATNMCAGVEEGLRIAKECEAHYQQAGIEHFEPVVLIVSDGKPNIGSIEDVADECRSLEAQDKLRVIPVGVGPRADMQVLAKFSQKQQPIRLAEGDLERFFRLFSESIRKVSIEGCEEPLVWREEGCHSWSIL